MGKIFSCQLYNRIYIHNVIHRSIEISDFEDEYENKIIDQVNINIPDDGDDNDLVSLISSKF